MGIQDWYGLGPGPGNGVPEGGATGVGSQWDWRNQAANETLRQYYQWQALKEQNGQSSRDSAMNWANSEAGRDAAARQAAYAPISGYYNAYNQGVGQAAGYQTEAMRKQALSALHPVSGLLQQYSTTGGYMPGEIEQLTGNAYSQTLAAAGNAADSLNNSMAQRGLGGDPLAGASLRSAGGFAAAANRGQLAANIKAQQVQNRLGATQGWLTAQQSIADLYKGPTQESALGALGSMKKPDFQEAYGQLAPSGGYGGGKGSSSGDSGGGNGSWNLDDAMAIYDRFRTAPVTRAGDPGQGRPNYTAPVRRPGATTMGGY